MIKKLPFDQIVYTFVIYKYYIMKTLSLKLDDSIFEETEEMTEYLKKSRNRYINDALDHFNKLQRRKMLAEQLERESRLVAENSKEVLKEMEGLEDGDQAV